MREVTYEGDSLTPILDAQMSKMSPEQRVAMASLNEEAKKRAAEKLKWDKHQAKEKIMEEIEIAAQKSVTYMDEIESLPEPLDCIEEVPAGIERAHKQGGPDGVDFKEAVEAMIGVPQVTCSLRYTQDTLAAEFVRIFRDELMALRNAGQKEYAHDTSSPFANFERGAKDMGIDRKQVLWVYAMKHKDGIAAAIKGHTSQREDVRGRINDLIVYLLLLRGIYNEEAGNTGSFGLGDLDK